MARETRSGESDRMKERSFKAQRVVRMLALAGVIMTGCAGIPHQPEITKVPEVAPGYLMPYLPPKDHPNGLMLLPQPPAGNAAAFVADRETAREARALRNSPRWKLAIDDADLKFPHAAGTFSCAIGAPISEKDTPRLFLLLRRAETDAILSTLPAKKQYQRPRPFVFDRETTCTPDAEKELASEGSYPSGHSAVGWAWALILTEIAPERMDAILERGRAFAESRVICGVHWHSDIAAGMVLGAGTVARLHAVAAFRSDLEAARAELDAVRAKGLPPTRDCEAVW